MRTRTDGHEAHFQIGAVRVSLGSPIKALHRQYLSLYRDFQTTHAADDAVRIAVRPSRPSLRHHRRYEIEVNGRPRFAPGRFDEVLPYVEWSINWELARVLPQFLQLHASSMEVDGQGVIFPGVSGSGKSTLTVALLTRGWRYLCDEFALLHHDSLQLHPFPRAICLKKPSFPVVRALGAPLRGERHYHKGTKGKVAFLCPLAVSPNAIGSVCPIRFVIFPRYVPGASPALRPISRAQAAFDLHHVCFNLFGCQRPGIEILTSMIRGAACYRLVTGDLNATCDLLDAHVRPSGSLALPGGSPEHAGWIPGAQIPERHDRSVTARCLPRRVSGTDTIVPTETDAGSTRRVSPGDGRTEAEESIRRDRPTLARALAAPLGEISPSTYGEERLVHTACKEGVAGLLLERVTQLGIELPAPRAAQLRDAAMLVAARNIHVDVEIAPVLRALNDAGVPVMLLKGAALNHTLYPRPDLRPVSDVDLLIRPEHITAALRVMEAQGCRRGFDLVRDDFFPKYHYEIELFTGSSTPVRIDLHVRPLRPLRVSRTMPDDALWQQTRAVSIGGASAAVPGPELMFLHLAAHAAYHGCSRLLWLYDLKRVVDAYAREMDWSLIADRSAAWRLSRPVLVAIQRATALFGPFCPPELTSKLADHPVSWRDRLALAQAPRDATSPLTHILVDLLCTPGVRFRAGYLAAVLRPEPGHLADLYPLRHPGWPACACAVRVFRVAWRSLGGVLRRAAALTRTSPHRVHG